MFMRFLFLFLFIVGQLFFAQHNFCSAQQFVSADPVPWSGHWWPFSQGSIGTGIGYRGHPSPLEKYLLLTTGTESGPALDWYLEYYYDPFADDWWGLCPAYARSAVKETYSILPSVHDNIVFRVGDKKGLLALCHDSRGGVIYTTGNPVNFHFWLLDYIHDQKKAFAADLILGEEVWYFPVYAYEMTSVRSGLTENVNVAILYAAHMGPDYMGTQAMEAGPYTYSLDLDAQGNIVGGRWTGDSVFNHPETLSYPESPGSENPYLSAHDCTKIKQIARAKDDELELAGESIARLLPGAYHLVLLDEDVYSIEGEAGDIVNLDIFRENGSNQAMDVVLADSDEVLIWEHLFEKSDDPEVFEFTLANPPYTLRVTQENYVTDPNIYCLTMDYRGAYDCIIPYIPKNGPWSGFAVTNASVQETAEVMLVTQDMNGIPLQTVFGPDVLKPGKKNLFHLSSLPIREHEFSGTGGLKLISNQPVSMVNLFADDQGPMAGFNVAGLTGNRIIIPDIYDNDPWDPQYMTGAVVNETSGNMETTWNFYSEQGDLIDSFSENLSPYKKIYIEPGSAPFFNVPDGGWMEVLASDVSAALSGYFYISSQKNQQKILETSHALLVSDETLYIQHVTLPSGPWQTTLTLINPNPYKNRVVVHPLRTEGIKPADMIMLLNPYEKRLISLSLDFGTDINRSVLEISGSAALCGHVSYEGKRGDAAFLEMLTDDDFKPELVLPHTASNTDRWWTGVGVCNPNFYPVTALVIPSDKSGDPLMSEETELVLAPGGYEIFTIKQMFGPMAQDIAFLKIFTDPLDSGNIGGFYLYGNRETQDLKAQSQVTGGNM